DLLYGKKSAVDISYYATTTLPLGIAMGLLMGFGQLLWWTRSDRKAFRRALAPPLILALVALPVFVAMGVHSVMLLAFLFAAAFALFVNLQVGWTIVKGNPKLAGGAIAHIGVTLLFFGFIASSEYDGTQTVSLPQGTPVETLGYRLTYTGYDVLEGERHAFNVLVEKDGQSFRLAPVMYFSTYNEGVMRHPDIANLYLKDFYLAPLGLEEPASQGGTAGVSTDTLVVEASVKPLINLVWAGVIVLLVGFGVTIVRRGEEAAGRERRSAGLRSGAPENPDAEQVHKLAAEPGGAPEQNDAGAGQKEIETR
ncbi:MAG: ccmF, partial [Bacteroidetes bacterium]|nr:ccmF [Bacteroidota bacterium]